MTSRQRSAGDSRPLHRPPWSSGSRFWRPANEWGQTVSASLRPSALNLSATISPLPTPRLRRTVLRVPLGKMGSDVRRAGRRVSLDGDARRRPPVVITNDEVSEWIDLMHAGAYGVVIKRLDASSGVSEDGDAAAAGSREAATRSRRAPVRCSSAAFCVRTSPLLVIPSAPTPQPKRRLRG